MKAGWEIKKLGEVVEVQNGYAFDSKKFSVNGQVPLIRIRDLKRGTFTETSYSGTFDPRYLVHKGDLLIGMDGEFGCHEWKGDPALLNQRVCRLQNFNAELEPRFLLYGINAYLKEIEEVTGYTTVKHLSSRQILNINFPIPPLSEQAHIVGILDEAFASIATAKANTQKNLENAKAVFESHLNSVFSNRGEGWIEKPFEDLIESHVIGLIKNSREQGSDKAWPYVKMNNITRDNRFDFSSLTHVDATAEEVSKFSLKNGDFLFNTRNSHELVGKSCIYESDSTETVLYNNNIMRVRFRHGIDSKFVVLAFSSKAVVESLNGLKSGTTNVSAIYFKDLKSLVIPIPQIAEQTRITAKMEYLQEGIQHLICTYERKLSALEDLKKSLLHQAFTGKL